MTLTPEQKEAARIRQENRRKRLRDAGLDGKRQLSALVSGESFYRFERLAKHLGVTKSMLLEAMIQGNWERVTSRMSKEEFEQMP